MAGSGLSIPSLWHGLNGSYVVEADLKLCRERETDGIVRRVMNYQSQVPDSRPELIERQKLNFVMPLYLFRHTRLPFLLLIEATFGPISAAFSLAHSSRSSHNCLTSDTSLASASSHSARYLAASALA